MNQFMDLGIYQNPLFKGPWRDFRGYANPAVKGGRQMSDAFLWFPRNAGGFFFWSMPAKLSFLWTRAVPRICGRFWSHLVGMWFLSIPLDLMRRFVWPVQLVMSFWLDRKLQPGYRGCRVPFGWTF